MVSGIDGSVFPIITSGVLYSATGAIILLAIRNTVAAGTNSKRMTIVGTWLSVIMMTAVAADQLSGRLAYSRNQRVALGVLFAVVCISACIVTYRLSGKSPGGPVAGGPDSGDEK